ncbi:hypothetical protein scyTo_0006185 [Scyliorhinus torazame]|uniref:Uncharacterized protein n=1 Tax=Scyliorhinus torazame TaxID=75743 RepID=A0A401PGD6_SCYTO|nr:hypothetical protein [Scyliorhinus torazame]
MDSPMTSQQMINPTTIASTTQSSTNGSTKLPYDYGEQGSQKNGSIKQHQKKTVVPFAVKLKMQELEAEKLEVEMLNVWEPAAPLISPLVSNDVKRK